MSRFELGPVALRAKLEPGPSQHRAGMLVAFQREAFVPLGHDGFTVMPSDADLWVLVEPLARRLPAPIEAGTLALRTIVGAGTALRFRSVLP